MMGRRTISVITQKVLATVAMKVVSRPDIPIFKVLGFLEKNKSRATDREKIIGTKFFQRHLEFFVNLGHGLIKGRVHQEDPQKGIHGDLKI